MTPEQKNSFYMASGIHAAQLNAWLRLTVGLLMIVAALFILIGLIKLLEDGVILNQFRFLLYLLALATVLMLFFTFVVA